MFILIHNPALFIQTFVRRMISCYMFKTQKIDLKKQNSHKQIAMIKNS